MGNRARTGPTAILPAMKPKDRSNPERLVTLLAPQALVASVITLACFYTVLYLHDNKAPEVDLTGFSIGPQAGFEHGMDKCRVTGSKFAASGWLTRIGKEPHRRSMRVVLLDHANGRGYALDTTLRERANGPGVDGQAAGDPVYSGFSASLNPSVADRRIRDGQMYIAYDDSTTKILLPLPCNVRWP